MLQVTLIGHIGGDAEVKNVDGREFCSFRVANTERWTDDAGQVHDTTTWVDCTMDGRPKVLEYLKRGQQVFVQGSATLRVYSSAKDRCMKAGLRVRVRSVELLGGRTDDVPSKLYDANDGHEVSVNKYYLSKELVRDKKAVEWWPLVSRNGERFVADRNGWIAKFNEPEENHDTNAG